MSNAAIGGFKEQAGLARTLQTVIEGQRVSRTETVRSRSFRLWQDRKAKLSWILILYEERPRSSAWESDDEDQKEQHEISSTCRCDFKNIPATLPRSWQHKLLFQNVNRLETVT